MSDVNQTPELITPAVYGILAGVFVLVLTVFVLFSTGSIIAVFILWLLIALIVVVLAYYEFIDLAQIADSLFPEEKKKKTQAAEGVQYARGATLLGGEVFHVSDNKFTFEEAPAVCAAYQAELATLEQIIEAYNNGAEWCNYGWSVGGMALYPTQKETWQKLQGEVDNGKRTRCGRPGVNGGYFDPLNKFGVNCYGVKPKGEFNPPAPLPGSDPKKFREMVDKFKAMLKAMSLSPYSRQTWSYTQPYGSQFEKKSQPNESGTGTVEKFTEYANEFTENVAKDSAYTASPLFLRGDQGPVGPKGESGPAGPIGLSGPPGPAGPEGPQGGIGPAGVKGDTGPEGPQGKEGPAGKDGKDGKSIDINTLKPEEREKIRGVEGKTGPTGPTGPTGGTGPTGPSGTVDTNTLTTRINELLKSIFGGDPNAVVAKKSDITDFVKKDDPALKNVGVDEGEDMVRSLVTSGGALNYNQCIENSGIAKYANDNFKAKGFLNAGDHSFALCSKYYNNPSFRITWRDTVGRTYNDAKPKDDDRKPQYKLMNVINTSPDQNQGYFLKTSAGRTLTDHNGQNGWNLGVSNGESTFETVWFKPSGITPLRR